MKLKFYSIFFIVVAFVFTGCIQNISPQGLTISVPASQITQSLQKQFPINQDFDYGKITLKEPKASLKKGSDRVVAGTSIGVSSALIPTQSGSLYVSGKPYFDASSGAVYLREPNIEKLEFNGYQIASFMKGPLKDALIPIVNEVFKNTPIYTLDKSSFQKSFVNNIRVEDGELLITFGL